MTIRKKIKTALQAIEQHLGTPMMQILVARYFRASTILSIANGIRDYLYDLKSRTDTTVDTELLNWLREALDYADPTIADQESEALARARDTQNHTAPAHPALACPQCGQQCVPITTPAGKPQRYTCSSDSLHESYRGITYTLDRNVLHAT